MFSVDVLNETFRLCEDHKKTQFTVKLAMKEQVFAQCDSVIMFSLRHTTIRCSC